MNLEEFIKVALAEIISGVAAARDEAAKHGAVVGSDRVYGHTKETKLLTDDSGRTVSLIEFDIVLAEASAKDTKGGSVSFWAQSALVPKARLMVSLLQTPVSSFQSQSSYQAKAVNLFHRVDRPTANRLLALKPI